MKAIFAPIALFIAGAFAQNSMTINTPSNVVECEPTLLSWSGGTAPYYLRQVITPGATPNGAALESFPATNANSLTWVCNIASNTNIGFTLRDSTGVIAQTASVVVNSGSSNSCLNTTSISAGPTGATSAAASTGGATTGGVSTGTGTASSTSASAQATSSSSASVNVAQFGAAGVVGAAVVALFL